MPMAKGMLEQQSMPPTLAMLTEVKLFVPAPMLPRLTREEPQVETIIITMPTPTTSVLVEVEEPEVEVQLVTTELEEVVAEVDMEEVVVEVSAITATMARLAAPIK